MPKPSLVPEKLSTATSLTSITAHKNHILSAAHSLDPFDLAFMGPFGLAPGGCMAEAAVAGYQLKESACLVKFRIVKSGANLTGVAKYGSADLNQAESPVVNTIPWKWERP